MSGLFMGAGRNAEFQASGLLDVKVGTAVLVAGTVVVADPNVTALTKIRLYHGGAIGGGATGAVFISAKSVGVSFTIQFIPA